jgi:hypothetical protein
LTGKLIWFGMFLSMDPAIREYMAKNGAKGGRANKGTESRRKIAKAAVEARWAKWRAKQASAQTESSETPRVKAS